MEKASIVFIDILVFCFKRIDLYAGTFNSMSPILEGKVYHFKYTTLTELERYIYLTASSQHVFFLSYSNSFLYVLNIIWCFPVDVLAMCIVMGIHFSADTDLMECYHYRGPGLQGTLVYKG